MERIIRTIQQNIGSASGFFLAQSEAALSVRPAPGKWSKKEIIGHLCDSAFNNIQRVVRGQYENNPQINYEQDNWVSIGGYNTYSREEIMGLWQSLNLHLCKILRQMPAENYTKTCVMMSMGGETKSYTLQWIAEDYVRHMEHHLKQVMGKTVSS